MFNGGKRDLLLGRDGVCLLVSLSMFSLEGGHPARWGEAVRQLGSRAGNVQFPLKWL